MGANNEILGEAFDEEEIMDLAEFFDAVASDDPPPGDHTFSRLLKLFSDRVEEIIADD